MESLHPNSTVSKRIWSDFTAHFRSETTVRSYQSDLKECCEYLDKCFSEFDKDDVKRYFDWLLKRVEAGELRPGTMSKKFRECHSMAEFLNVQKEGYEVKQGFEDYFYPYLKQVAKQEKFAKSIPVEEIDRLFVAAQADLMTYLVFTLLYRVGLSSTEIIGIKIKDIEEYADGVYVWIAGRREASFLPEDVVEVLVEYLGQSKEQEYLFCNRQGRPLNTMYISRLMKKYAALAGIPPYSAESLRNSCAFTMYAYGAKDKQVAMQLGTTRMQIKRYDDIRYKNHMQRQAANLVKIKMEPPK